VLSDDLMARGGFNLAADAQLRPFFIVAVHSLGLAITGFLITALGAKPLGMIGVAGLISVALGAWALGANYSRRPLAWQP